MQPIRKRSGKALLLANIFCCIVVLGAVLAHSILICDTEAAGQVRQRRAVPSASEIKVGEFPPDFELPRLKLGEDRAGRPVGIISEKQTWRLSSFRGKKPVCMIMSSYT